MLSDDLDVALPDDFDRDWFCAAQQHERARGARARRSAPGQNRRRVRRNNNDNCVGPRSGAPRTVSVRSRNGSIDTRRFGFGIGVACARRAHTPTEPRAQHAHTARTPTANKQKAAAHRQRARARANQTARRKKPSFVSVS
jgi:hypothetical protein